MPSEYHFLEELHKELALALGDAVWAFSRIEWLVYERLGNLSKDRLDELVGELNFRPRTAMLRRLVERQSTEQSAKFRALKAIEDAEKLSDRRNLIVHNPWRIWADINAREFMTEIQKYSNRGKNLDLKGVRKFAEDCRIIESEMSEALNSL